jgi:SAM-dependent methyltransferase
MTGPAEHGFDRDYWDEHWRRAQGGSPPNPYLERELSGLTPGTALDAGCGEGAEAVWLAEHGWQVTAADISERALARAVARAAASAPARTVRWVQSDLGVWAPEERFDLVTTHYAHPALPQLAFYDRIAGWVAPGGTLLLVGHLQTPGRTGHGHQPPAEAAVTLADVTAGLDPTTWEVVTAEERVRSSGPAGHRAGLRDVVVRARRRPG